MAPWRPPEVLEKLRASLFASAAPERGTSQTKFLGELFGAPVLEPAAPESCRAGILRWEMCFTNRNVLKNVRKGL